MKNNTQKTKVHENAQINGQTLYTVGERVYKDVGFVGCISKMAYLFMLNEFVLVDHWLLAEKVKQLKPIL